VPTIVGARRRTVIQKAVKLQGLFFRMQDKYFNKKGDSKKVNSFFTQIQTEDSEDWIPFVLPSLSIAIVEVIEVSIDNLLVDAWEIVSIHSFAEDFDIFSVGQVMISCESFVIEEFVHVCFGGEHRQCCEFLAFGDLCFLLCLHDGIAASDVRTHFDGVRACILISFPDYSILKKGNY